MSETARKLTSGSALRVVNLLAQLVFSFVMMPFIVGRIGDQMYGLWLLVGKIVDYYALLDVGITAAVSRHIAGAMGAKDDRKCNEVINNALALYSGVALLVVAFTGFLFFMAPFFAKNPDEAALFRNVIVLLGLNTAIEFPVRVFGGIMTAQLRYDVMSLLKLGSLVLRVAGIITLLNLGYGLFALALVTVISGIPEKIAYIYYAKRSFPQLHLSRTYLSRASVRTLYGYGVYVFLIQIGDMLKFNMDSIIITAFIGLAAVTHYGIATQMTINFMILMGTIMGVLMPVFSRLESENDQLRIKKAFFLTTKIAICLASFIAFGLIFWGKYFIERWMGPDYLDAYPCLVILVIGCTVSQWQSASLAILFGTSKHKYYAIANGIEAALNIGLSLLLVRKYGIVGMAIGVVTPTILIVLFVQPVYVCRLIGISLKEYLNEVARTLVAVVGALVIPLAITRFYGAAMYGRLLAVGAASLIAYLPVVAMYAFKAQESTLIRKAIMPRRFA